MSEDGGNDHARQARLAAALRANLKRRKAGRHALAEPAERDGGAEEHADEREHDD